MESQRHNFQRCDACNTTDGCNGVLPVIDLCAQTVKMNRIATLRSVMEAEGIGCGFDVRGDERLKAYNIG